MNSDKNFTEHPEILITQAPENVLEQLMVELKDPIRTIEDLLPRLITEQDDEKTIASQLEQAVLIAYERMQLRRDYLNSRVRNNISETGNVAEAILRDFTHHLRECAAPLKGFVSVYLRIKLPEDELKPVIAAIEFNGKSLIKAFRMVEENWRTWLVSDDFDWERYT